MAITTKWSTASDTRIHCYDDPDSIESVALASNVYDFHEIRNADAFDFTSRAVTVEENEIVIIKSKIGFYTLIRVVDVKCKGRGGDDRNELTIEWLINPDKKNDFSK